MFTIYPFQPTGIADYNNIKNVMAHNTAV